MEYLQICATSNGGLYALNAHAFVYAHILSGQYADGFGLSVVCASADQSLIPARCTVVQFVFE